MNYEFFVFVKNIFSFTILTLFNICFVHLFIINPLNAVTMKPSIHQLLGDGLYSSNLTQYLNVSCELLIK